MTDTECAALMTEWERLEAWGDGAYYGFVAWMRKHGPAFRERLLALEAENERLRQQVAALTNLGTWQDETPERKWWHSHSGLTSYTTREAAAAHLIQVAFHYLEAAERAEGDHA